MHKIKGLIASFGLLVLLVLFQNCGRLPLSIVEALKGSSQSTAPDSAPHFCANPSSWNLLDDYQLSSNGVTAARSILVDPVTSELYVLGYAQAVANGPYSFLLRKSTDGGLTWQNDEQYNYDPGSGPLSTLGFVLKANSSGDLFATGYTYSGGYKWMVRRKLVGQPWQTVDYFGTGYTFAEGMELTSDGNIYVVGETRDVPNRWITRKSADRGSTWTTVDDFIYLSGFDSKPRAVATKGTTIYVAGMGKTAAGVARWLVRKSVNGGTSWTTSEDFAFSPGQDSHALRIGVSPKGHIFVAGYALDENGKPIFLVRRSLDDGYSWTTVYQFESTESVDRYFDGSLTFDKSGNPIVSSNFISGTIIGNYIFAGDNLGSSWRVFEKYLFPGGEDTRTDDLLYTSNNEFFAVGPATGGNKLHWVTRKLSCGN